MRKRSHRGQRGVSLIELGAAMAFGLPMVVAMLYCICEANFLFTIRTNLDAAVRQWGQVYVNNYTGAAAGTGSDAYAQSQADATVSIPHFVVANNGAGQISHTLDTSGSPHTVTVYCSYPGATPSAQVIPFPYPDPLNLGPSFKILVVGTFAVNPE